MKGFKAYLSERKQVGTLYHFTDYNGLKGILKNNNLVTTLDYISFTRDYGRSIVPYLSESRVRIVLNGDKLSDKYKLQPYRDPVLNDYDEYGDFPEQNLTKNPEEFEERIKTKKIPNINKYIKHIDVEFIKPLLGDDPTGELLELAKKYNIKIKTFKKGAKWKPVK